MSNALQRLHGIADPLPAEPMPDIAICSECGWRGPATKCQKGTEGDWESGYYEVDYCPRCEDGGCIDDYDYSPEQWEELEAHDLLRQKKETMS